MRIAFLGYGNVGASLAVRLQQLGHHVTLAARNPASSRLRKALESEPRLTVAEPAVAVGGAEIVFLATPFQANEEVLKDVAHALAGRIVVDCTNPVGPGLSHGLQSLESGSQRVQKQVPAARVVKAFSIYGFESLENSSYPSYGVRPAMMFCGDDAAAKAVVALLIGQLGFEPVDVGGLEQALHLEHLTLLWVRMVRVKGATPQMAWARLVR